MPASGSVSDTSLADWASGNSDFSSADTSIADGGATGITWTPPVPNDQLTYLDLPGQFDSIPGGSSHAGMYPGGAADPSGINSVHLSPTVNPTPTGGYMPVAAAIATAAMAGFSTYAKGSPSVATPPPRYPGGSMTSSMLTGKTNWIVIGGVLLVGIGVIAWLAMKA